MLVKGYKTSDRRNKFKRSIVKHSEHRAQNKVSYFLFFNDREFISRTPTMGQGCTSLDARGRGLHRFSHTDGTDLGAGHLPLLFQVRIRKTVDEKRSTQNSN